MNACNVRRGLSLTLLSLLVGVGAVPAAAQDYPSRPIKLVVPYPPGGATDVIGRVMAQKLSGVLGQQVVVDNRAGAAGSIGAAAVGKSAPDGYTLLMGALTSHSINANLYGAAATGFDIEKSFAPVAVVGVVPLVFVVNPSVKANSLSELIALAKAAPGTLSFASAGNGSPQHLAGELFQRMAGVSMLHVPYKGSGPAMNDLVGGQVNSMIETAPAALQLIKSGKLRALATATAQPVGTLPGVPTAAQAGLKDFEVSSIFGILAPAGTPAAVVGKLNGELKGILQQAEVRDSMLAQGAVAMYTTPEEASAAIRAESDKWAKVIKDGNIKGD
ncbi:MAG: tripartite tricarboxylate transporter substrate binding protein [Hylemonella sp.]|nr:tripartite tricarboxylate transporter substrate binding protein [Hylemonella sp.]